MTEVGLATLNPPSGEIRQGSIGKPIHGSNIALRDEKGATIEGGEVGKIWIRSPSRTVGYREAPGATEEVVIEGWSTGRSRPGGPGRLPLVLGRKKQIGHDGSNIPVRGEGALVEHPAVSWPEPSASTTRSTAKTCAPT